MSMGNRIAEDTKQAMIRKDAVTLSVLRMLRSALHNKAIELKTDELTDEQSLKVLQTEAKKRKDAIAAYQQGGREELAQKEATELTVIEGYLPAQLDDAALEQMVTDAIAAAGDAPQFGTVMKTVMATARGQADGTRVSALVKAKMTP